MPNEGAQKKATLQPLMLPENGTKNIIQLEGGAVMVRASMTASSSCGLV